jgi:hypothetical protein
LTIIAGHKTVTIAVPLNDTLKFFQQAAGLADILDIILSFL